MLSKTRRCSTKSMWTIGAFVFVLPGLVGAQSIEPNAVGGACPAGWFDPDWLDGFGCLLFNDTHHMTWESAARACQEDHGGFLLKIATQEQKAFVAMMLETLYGTGIGPRWWVGATDNNHEGRWVWPDLSPVEDFVWHSGQPDGGLAAEFGYVYSEVGGGLCDIDGTLSWPFICQREREQVEQPASESHSRLRRGS